MKPKNTKELCHVTEIMLPNTQEVDLSYRTKEQFPKFIPRIPPHPLKGENTEIPRICLANSLQGALSAVSWGGPYLQDACERFLHVFEKSYYQIGHIDCIYDSLLFGCYIFHVDETSPFLIQPETLSEKGWVSDAELTGEHWYIGDHLIPSSFHYIGLRYFKGQDVFLDDLMYVIRELEVRRYDSIEDIPYLNGEQCTCPFCSRKE